DCFGRVKIVRFVPIPTGRQPYGCDGRTRRGGGTMSRVSFLLLISVTSVAALASVGRPAGSDERRDDAALGRTIMVPFDHKSSAVPGTGPLYFEFGARFDASKPTVLVIADGQQYYVRKGTVAALQKDLFGDAFNVVGIVTRGTTPEFIKAAL